MLVSLCALGKLQLKALKAPAAFSEIIITLVLVAALSPHCSPFHSSPSSPQWRVCQCQAPLFPCQISPSGPPSLKIQHLPFHALLSTSEPSYLGPKRAFTFPASHKCLSSMSFMPAFGPVNMYVSNVLPLLPLNEHTSLCPLKSCSARTAPPSNTCRSFCPPSCISQDPWISQAKSPKVWVSYFVLLNAFHNRAHPMF